MSNSCSASPEDVLRMLERATSTGVWRLDVDSGDLDWSDQLAAIHGAAPGYGPDEPLAHYAPESRSKVEALLAACIAEGTAFDEEVQILQLDGRRSWVRSLAQPVQDAQGRVVAVQGALQEIAPRGAHAGTLLRMG